MGSHQMLHEICLLFTFKGAVIYLYIYFYNTAVDLSPRLLMTSITAYLTALAHSSRKQRVLKADIQTSTGDTDVCRQKCSMSVFREALLLQRY